MRGFNPMSGGPKGPTIRTGGGFGGAGGGGGGYGGWNGQVGGAAGQWGASVSDNWKHWGRDAGQNLGFGDRKQREMQKEGDRLSEQQHNETMGDLGDMAANEDAYLGMYGKNQDAYRTGRDAAIDKYDARVKGLSDEAEKQSKDASSTYGSLKGEYTSLMEDARTNAGSAMTLSQAGDPNNAVQQGVRKMYGDQAAGVGKQALADYGVMSALGAQATANQLGGMPISGGQMMAAQSANQGQASQAYMNAQRRMHDLQQQGIDRGFEESDRQYQRGQQAKDRYRQSVGDIQGLEDWHQGTQGRLRGERAGYHSDRFGVQMNRASDNYNLDQGMADTRLGFAQGREGREMAAKGARYDYLQGGISNAIGRENAMQAGKTGLLGSAITAGGTAAGGYFGGPQGAQAGNAAGQQTAAGVQGAAGNQYRPAYQQSGQRGQGSNYGNVA